MKKVIKTGVRPMSKTEHAYANYAEILMHDNACKQQIEIHAIDILEAFFQNKCTREEAIITFANDLKAYEKENNDISN